MGDVVRALNYGFVNNPDMMQERDFFFQSKSKTSSSNSKTAEGAEAAATPIHTIDPLSGIKYCRFVCDKIHRLDLFGLEFWCT